MLYLKSQSVRTVALALGGLVCAVPATYAQAPGQSEVQSDPPIFRVNVFEFAERTTQAVSYRNRSGATKIDFEGTPLLKKANGEAKVESKQGYTEIEVEFDDMAPATQFGPEYLTYILWAITPEGRATNLGELLLNGDRAKLDVTTDLQAFSLLVTAEPYFSVSQPSDVVVLENVIRKDTQGTVQPVEAKFELLKRGTYAKNLPSGTLQVRKVDKNTPLELLEAENAITLVRAAGAEQYAKDTFDKAVANLTQAQKYAAQAKNRKPAIAAARQAVQVAEDARLITVQREEEARLNEERRVATARTNEANAAAAQSAAQARAEADARQQAELNARRSAEERARAEADKARADAAAAQSAARAEAEIQARKSAEEAARVSAAAKAEADAARLAADQARAAAETARAEAAREADRLARERTAAEAAREQAQRDATEARALAAKADQERAELRDRLQQQLTLILETKQTARGLIVNMSDVLFDVGKSTLKPGAREKLAKVAGIVTAHPDLTLQVEGHTDSTGSDQSNQRLSESRAAAARDFLVAQGVNTSNITSKGFGESNPVATNDTAAGRQQNRRVELVISGDSITPVNNPSTVNSSVQ